MQEEPNNFLHQITEPQGDSLKELMTLCQEYENLLEKKERINEEFTELKNKIETVGGTLIPDLMGEIGIESLSLSSGKKVSIRETFLPGVKADHMEQFHEWLEDNNHDSIVKKEFRVPEHLAEEVEAYLKQRYPEHPQLLEKIQKINHMTFRSWTKEMVTKELPLPDFFHVYKKKEVVIK